LNLASSRSHQIVRLYIESRPPSDGCPDSPASVSASKGAGGDGEDDWRPVTSACLCFVDLAGSERTSLGSTEEADSRLRQTEVMHWSWAVEMWRNVPTLVMSLIK
jgi:hypothetical protein